MKGLEDQVGNNGADAAADLGRSRQHDDVITDRDLFQVRRVWYPIMLDLHRFMVAVNQMVLVWDKGGVAKTRAPSFRLIVPDFFEKHMLLLDLVVLTSFLFFPFLAFECL